MAEIAWVRPSGLVRGPHEVVFGPAQPSVAWQTILGWAYTHAPGLNAAVSATVRILQLCVAQQDHAAIERQRAHLRQLLRQLACTYFDAQPVSFI